VPLALAGLGFTVYGYFDLGLENTYSSDDGLVTSGLYRYSRNPQYVASILAFLGLGLAAASADVALLCAFAIGVYVLLPLAEEPWLERTYGASYRRYKQRTPRFLSVAKLLEKPLGAER
jgi:protein-S-isoprenylcysteine O-methyltransferase Ste14